MPSPHARHVRQYRSNLRRHYARATPADIAEGLAWYPTAVAGSAKWAEWFGVNERTVACVIAAISPQCDWTSNLRIAFEVLSGQTLVTGGALRSNVAKARRILADKATSLDSYFKSGPKVTAFARNLSGDSDAVTIDTHAIQAALNDPTVYKGLHASAYEVIAGCYRDVARELGVKPCDFQAIIWCAWKRRYPRHKKNSIRRARLERMAA